MSEPVPRDQWTTPNLIGRIRSQQAGNPSGLLGRLIGRAMVKDTWAANRHNLELLGDVSGKTVLDIGFGQGRMAEALAQADALVLGAEVSDTMLTQATARNRDRVSDGTIDLRLGDGVHLPFDNGVADAATTAHTIYFMPDLATTIAETHRVLKPGSPLIIAFITADDGVAAWKDPDIYRSYLTDEVVQLVTDAGFDDATTHTLPGHPTDLRWLTATS